METPPNPGRFTFPLQIAVTLKRREAYPGLVSGGGGASTNLAAPIEKERRFWKTPRRSILNMPNMRNMSPISATGP
jgi:hypothetical protein